VSVFVSVRDREIVPSEESVSDRVRSPLFVAEREREVEIDGSTLIVCVIESVPDFVPMSVIVWVSVAVRDFVPISVIVCVFKIVPVSDPKSESDSVSEEVPDIVKISVMVCVSVAVPDEVPMSVIVSVSDSVAD